MGTAFAKRDVIKSSIIALLFVYASNCYNLLGWNNIVTRKYNILISSFILLLTLDNYSNIRFCFTSFHKYVFFVLFWPLFSIILGCDGSIPNEILSVYSWVPYILLFYLFYIYNVYEKHIILGMTVACVMGCIIQIFQQFYPETSIFGVIDPDSDEYYGKVASMRSGYYRFRIGILSLALFLACYYWNKLLNSKSIIICIYLALVLTYIYFSLTRQVILSTIFVFIYSFTLYRDRSTKRKSVIIIFLLLSAIYFYWDELFSSLTNDYLDDKYSTDIRKECVNYYLSYMYTNPLTLIWGKGHMSLTEVSARLHGFYVSDIGFLGQAFYFGILWAIVYIVFVIIIFKKYRKKIPVYIFLYFLSTFITSIMIFPYRNKLEMLVWVCTLYISDIYINDRVGLQEHD